jgi:transcriptional regulator with XRE-family HTH domain
MVAEVRVVGILRSMPDCLRNERKRRTWSLDTVARRAGVAVGTVSAIERGDGRAPNMVTYLLVCVALDIAPHELLRRAEEAAAPSSHSAAVGSAQPGPSDSASSILVDPRDERAFAHAVGQLLCRTRRKQGLTLEDVDQKSGIYCKRLGEMERGDRPIDLHTLKIWCMALAVSPVDVISQAMMAAHPGATEYLMNGVTPQYSGTIEPTAAWT